MSKRMALIMEAGGREAATVISDVTVNELYYHISNCLRALLELGFADEPIKLTIKDWSFDD